jgi:23S rRNA pseudouridine1911/1915/1917 synthase
MPLNQGYVYREQVRAKDAGAEVLAYHAARFPHSSLEEWSRAIAEGRVLVNGRSVACTAVLRAGDRLEFHRPPWEEPEVPRSFRVVHEDEDVLIVEKPAGLQVLPGGAFTASTLLHLVRTSSAARAESAPVHRLGRGTSGLVLFGKHKASRDALSEQFRARTARKTYLALARGTALPRSCIARHPIGRRAHGPLRVACVERDGQAAVTRLRVLAVYVAEDRTLVAAQPITGRADQIRVHLAACGAPIVGDPLYGPGGVPCSDATPGEGGYYLHATALRVKHPATGGWLVARSRPAWL